jgi:cobyrinic acid a,c-diamide synthase
MRRWSTTLREIPPLGSMPRHDSGLPERHLGLVLPAEVQDLERRLDVLASPLALIAGRLGHSPASLVP